MSIVEKAIDKHLRQHGGQAPQDRPPRRVVDLEPPPEQPLAPPPGDDDLQPILPPQRAPDDQDVVRIDLDRLAAAGVMPYGDTEHQIAGEYRRIKRPLLMGAFGKDRVERGNLIMVTSALAGEGKTFTATNLAMSIAMERDRTVVLVDGDIAKAHISGLLDVDGRPGLMDVLLDPSVSVGDVLLRTDVPSLKLISAGQCHEHATELFASDRMEVIATEMSQRYEDRVIVFDSPPVLQTAEAPVLAALMGQIVMVVHAGATPQRAVRTALEMLPEERTSMLLNKSRAPTTDYYYGYHKYGSR